ncbi:hypothetical protein ACHQM5_011734 [Ranunculus cassubicifolius]
MTSVAAGSAGSSSRLSTTIGGGARVTPNGLGQKELCGYFEMPLHYPRYTRADYESMPEWKLDCLLAAYGMRATGENLEQKRKFAMGAFLWT